MLDCIKGVTDIDKKEGYQNDGYVFSFKIILLLFIFTSFTLPLATFIIFIFENDDRVNIAGIIFQPRSQYEVEYYFQQDFFCYDTLYQVAMYIQNNFSGNTFTCFDVVLFTLSQVISYLLMRPSLKVTKIKIFFVSFFAAKQLYSFFMLMIYGIEWSLVSQIDGFTTFHRIMLQTFYKPIFIVSIIQLTMKYMLILSIIFKSRMIKVIIALRFVFQLIFFLNIPFYMYLWLYFFKDSVKRTFNNINNLRVEYQFENEFRQQQCLNWLISFPLIFPLIYIGVFNQLLSIVGLIGLIISFQYLMTIFLSSAVVIVMLMILIIYFLQFLRYCSNKFKCCICLKFLNNHQFIDDVYFLWLDDQITSMNEKQMLTFQQDVMKEQQILMQKQRKQEQLQQIIGEEALLALQQSDKDSQYDSSSEKDFQIENLISESLNKFVCQKALGEFFIMFSIYTIVVLSVNTYGYILYYQLANATGFWNGILQICTVWIYQHTGYNYFTLNIYSIDFESLANNFLATFSKWIQLF